MKYLLSYKAKRFLGRRFRGIENRIENIKKYLKYSRDLIREYRKYGRYDFLEISIKLIFMRES